MFLFGRKVNHYFAWVAEIAILRPVGSRGLGAGRNILFIPGMPLNTVEAAGAAGGEWLRYFSRMNMAMGVPWKSHFSRILFSRKRR